jgi:hypothetical protein
MSIQPICTALGCAQKFVQFAETNLPTFLNQSDLNDAWNTAYSVRLEVDNFLARIEEMARALAATSGRDEDREKKLHHGGAAH